MSFALPSSIADAPPAAPAPVSFAVMGAGAMGSYLGALLAHAGLPVRLIGRAAHVQAIQAQGLRLQTATLDVSLPMAAHTDAAAVQGVDVVLLCVKATDLEAAARQLQPHLAPHTLVLALQNGVDSAERLRAVLGPTQALASAVVYAATRLQGPGHVWHGGGNDVVLGPQPLGERLLHALQAAGLNARSSDNLRGTLWAKLIVNCAYNALSAITQRPYGWLVAQPGALRLIDDVLDECLAVARADGVQLPPPSAPEDASATPLSAEAALRANVHALAQRMPLQRSSTAQDLARGRISEIEHLNGYVVQRGAALAVPTPVNHTLLVLVRMLQTPPGA